MPQINRIRIINFSYNNNSRNIVDETFDFYQGENALLNLKNGGGKSVLVQLLLQPIIPKTKLMSRRIEDFFKGKKSPPTYVLIEWKLEDQGGYLLTGIGLTNKESQVREQDESNNSIKYFTFTTNYRQSNLFDIENIPLIKKMNEKIYVEYFKEAKKLLTLKEKDPNFSVSVFTDEDGREYRKHLESYNIFQDEWKSIILKINESEGGVIEIFEKCKTSQQLMNDWILKSIEKVVNKEDRDQKKLEQMLENLVEEMISNEQFIYEKDLYQEFLGETDKYITKLDELTNSLDKEKQLEKNITSMYYFLKHEIASISTEIERQQETIISKEAELKKIDLEERSKDYYDALENFDILTEKSAEEKDKLALVTQKLATNEYEAKLQQAAKEYQYIKIINTKIAGIKVDIDKIKNSGENNELIKNLEYSLKLAYEKVLKILKEKAVALKNKMDSTVITLEDSDHKLKELDPKLSELQLKKGAVGSKINDFEQNESMISEELAFNYERNLLGEIEEAYFDHYYQTVAENIASFENEKTDSSNEIDSLKQQSTETVEQISILRADEKQATIEATKLAEKVETYNNKESSIKPVFERYQLDYKKRFQHEEIHLFIKNKLNELQKIERDLDLNARTITETIASLKNGTLHVSKEFRQWLLNNDIDFETGENYLRKQTKPIRQRLVKQNPILPFAFLLNDEDIEKLKSLDLGLKTQQLVPILSYSEIDHRYQSDGHHVMLGDKLQFICLYDNKMIEAVNLDEYVAELNVELNRLNEQLNHYRDQLDMIREDIQLLKQFNYDKNYIHALETEKGNLDKRIQQVNSTINKLEQQQIEIKDNQNSLQTRITEIEKLVLIEAERKIKITKFRQTNDEYLQNRKNFKEFSASIEKIEKEKETINFNKRNLSEEKDTIYEQQVELKSVVKSNESSYKQYAGAAEAIQLDEDIEIMEERLKRLKAEIGSNLDRHESDLEDKINERNDKQDSLNSYDLEESQYIEINFSAEKLKELQEKIKKLVEEQQETDQSSRNVEGNLREAKGNLTSTEKELKKLAEMPIEKSQIKMNFVTRRKGGKADVSEAKNKIYELGKVSKEYETITNKIAGQVDVTKHEVAAGYKTKNGFEQDYRELVKELKYVREENKTHESNANLEFSKIKAKYESKNKHIENILAGLVPLIESAQSDKNKYYYVGERLLLSKESLDKLIKACEQRLSNVEKNKQDMIQHSYLQAKRVYEEIQKISENSSIKLDGKSRPIPMLKINMEPLNETAEENNMKMKGYIESCVSIINKDMKEEKKIEEIRKKISRYMSTKELLNVLSDLGKMTISAYKIDINAQNSRYKSWEQVMKENSGGERFVSFFAVIVALMSYTRTSMKFEDDYQRNKDTKVLIMDNPFGPISSEHLLKPLFKIAKKYNTQLICLTDLKQNSILNCFNLIYMIKIRQNVFGTNEYIQLEQQTKEAATMERDEKLEKAVFKAEEVEQINLF